MKRFKLGVKGFDGELFVAFLKWVMKNNWTCNTDIVSWEFNELSDGRISGDDANLALVHVGYEETVSNEFDWVWKYVEKPLARGLRIKENNLKKIWHMDYFLETIIH